jgi:hypothetical protein
VREEGGPQGKTVPKKLAPAAIVALKRALTAAYWYKNDLRSFISGTLNDPHVLSRINWSDPKRDIVSGAVDQMASDQQRYGDELLTLMFEVAKIDDFSHLERLEDGPSKARQAQEAIDALRKLLQGHDQDFQNHREAQQRKAAARGQAERAAGVRQKLAELRAAYNSLLCAKPQERGYMLEKMIKELFDVFDLDPRASFRVVGEQIDGAFTFDSTDYLFEGKWQTHPIGAADLDSLAGKLSRKLDNALGMLLSINGFSTGGIKTYSSGGRRTILLMDGMDLMAVLDCRISLPDMLLRKRRHASQTGDIYLGIADILAGRP